MNLNPAIVLDPVFHFLDGIFADYGLYLFSRVRLAVPGVAGLGVQRRVAREIPQLTARSCQYRHCHAAIPPSPPPPIIIHEYDPPDDDRN
jgi:hypothetical protein